MSVLRPPSISTSRFCYVQDEQTFAAEISELPDLRLGQVYDDACDVGFTLVSARTGRGIVFVETDAKRDSEGELLYQEFRPADQIAQAVRGAQTLRVQIFND